MQENPLRSTAAQLRETIADAVERCKRALDRTD
jgi:hypothetical protein